MKARRVLGSMVFPGILIFAPILRCVTGEKEPPQIVVGTPNNEKYSVITFNYAPCKDAQALNCDRWRLAAATAEYSDKLVFTWPAPSDPPVAVLFTVAYNKKHGGLPDAMLVDQNGQLTASVNVVYQGGLVPVGVMAIPGAGAGDLRYAMMADFSAVR